MKIIALTLMLVGIAPFGYGGWYWLFRKSPYRSVRIINIVAGTLFLGLTASGLWGVWTLAMRR
jgi:hypothetical protein